MRTKCMLFFLTLSLVVNAQRYEPMLTEGKTWQCVARNDEDTCRYTISIGSDTIVDGKTYHKMHYEYATDKKRNYDDVAREEDGRVYTIAHNYYTGETGEVVMLDFSLNVGDIAQTYRVIGDGGNIEEWYRYVTAVDTVEVRGVSRRRLTIDGSSCQWVEGIGSSEAWSVTPDAPTSIHHEIYMDSCYEDGTLLFTRDDFRKAPTAIRPVRTEEHTDDQAAYDLSGRRIAHADRGGIIITGGRKRVVRR